MTAPVGSQTIPPLSPDEVLRRDIRAAEHRARYGVITDLHAIEQINARIVYSQLPWWVRLTTPTPDGWGRS